MANMTQEQIELAKLQEQLKALQAENTRLQAEKAAVVKPRITVKCAEFGSGTVSVYGYQKFPISLYPEQWKDFLESTANTLKEFLQSNPNIIRAYAFASEYARKALNMKASDPIPAKASPARESWERNWTEGKNKALADPSLVPSARK